MLLNRLQDCVGRQRVRKQLGDEEARPKATLSPLVVLDNVKVDVNVS